MDGWNWKQALLSLVEHATRFLGFVGAFKVLDDLYLLSGREIMDFKDPQGFSAWLWTPSPVAILRDVALTWACFFLNRRLIRKRIAEARTRAGLPPEK